MINRMKEMRLFAGSCSMIYLRYRSLNVNMNYLRYRSLNVSIGFDEASCAGRGSSPVYITRAPRVPSAEVPRVLPRFCGGCDKDYCTRYSVQVYIIKRAVPTSVPLFGFI